MKLIILFLLRILFIPLLQAQDCSSQLESMPLQVGGRVKPLYVHSQEVIKHLTGKTSPLNISSLETYCTLSLSLKYSLNFSKNLYAPIQHVKLKKFLKLEKKDKKISFLNLVELKKEIRIELLRQTKETSYKKSLNKLFSRLHLYQEVKMGKNWKIPLVFGDKVQWTPIFSTSF